MSADSRRWPNEMNGRLQIAVLVLATCAGCGPVHIHQYLAQGRFVAEPSFGSIGIRATTTADPHDPNSFGASREPGATGFIIEFFGKGITSTVGVTNVRGTYSFRSGPTNDLAIQAIGRDFPSHYSAVYAIPTTALVPSGDTRIPQVLKYGDYSVTIRYDVQGITHSATGSVQYIHKSHWEIGTMGWKD